MGVAKPFCLLFAGLFALSGPGAEEAPIPAETKALTLSDAVSISLRYNFTFKASQYDEHAAKMEKREALSAYLPQAFWDSEASKLESDRFSTSLRNAGFAGDTYTNKFQVTQLIFDLNTIRAIHLADLRAQAAGWQRTGQEQQAVFDTVGAYLDILRAQRILDVQTQRVEFAEKQLTTTVNRYEAGYRTRTDVSRAELNKAQAIRDKNLAEADLNRSQVALNRALGWEVNRRHELDPRYLAFYVPSDQNLEELENKEILFKLADEHNPAIQIARILVRQFEESVRVAQGEFLPRLSAGGSWGYYDSGSLDLETEEWNAQLSLRIPLYEGGRKTAKVERSRDQLNAETMRYNNTVQSIRALVEEASLVLREEKQNLDVALQAEQVGKRNYQDFFNQYEEGLVQSLDVTQALTDLVVAQTDAIVAQFNYLRVYVKMLSALGTLPTHINDFLSPTWLSVPKVEVKVEAVEGESERSPSSSIPKPAPAWMKK